MSRRLDTVFEANRMGWITTSLDSDTDIFHRGGVVIVVRWVDYDRGVDNAYALPMRTIAAVRTVMGFDFDNDLSMIWQWLHDPVEVQP